MAKSFGSLDPGDARRFSESFDSNFSGGGGDPGGHLSLSSEAVASLKSQVSNLSFEDNSGDFDVTDASMRIAYVSGSDPYSPYSNLYVSVQQMENGTKIFLGQFTLVTGGAINLIQIPLIGQSIEELANSLNLVDGVRAEVLNNKEFENSSSIIMTGFYNSTNNWSYFFTNEDAGSSPLNSFSSLDQDVKFYLTSVEPGMSQNNKTQSFGGFISPTEMYETDILSNSISFYDTTLSVDNASLDDSDYVQIQDEIIQISSWDSGSASVDARNAFGTPLRFHPQGSVVRKLGKNDIFDSKFGRDRTQYRCIAIRNESDTEYMKDVKIYFNLLTRNSFSNTRISIELPRSEYYSSKATSIGFDSSFTDIGLASLYENDHYATASVTFTDGNNSGQTRIVSGYNGEDGTFILSERLPFVVNSGDSFYVGTAPSQRISNGTVPPSLDPIIGGEPSAPFAISSFQEAQFFADGLSIDIDDNRVGGNILKPGESIYVWIERRLEDSNRNFDSNRLFLTLGYSRS